MSKLLYILCFILSVTTPFARAKRDPAVDFTKSVERVDRTSQEWKARKDLSEDAVGIYNDMLKAFEKTDNPTEQTKIIEQYQKRIDAAEEQLTRQAPGVSPVQVIPTKPVPVPTEIVQPVEVTEPPEGEDEFAEIRRELEQEEEPAEEVEEEAVEEISVEPAEQEPPFVPYPEPPTLEEPQPTPVAPVPSAPIATQPVVGGGGMTPTYMGGGMAGMGMMGGMPMQQAMARQPAIPRQKATTKSRANSIKFIKDLDQAKRSGNPLTVVTGLENVVKTIKGPLPNVEMLANYEKGIKVGMMMPGMGMSREIKGVERREPLDEFRRTLLALPDFVVNPKAVGEGNFYDYVEKGRSAMDLEAAYVKLSEQRIIEGKDAPGQLVLEFGNLLASVVQNKYLKKLQRKSAIFTELTWWHLNEAAFLLKSLDIRDDIKWAKTNREGKRTLRSWAVRKVRGPTGLVDLELFIDRFIILTKKIEESTVVKNRSSSLRSFASNINTIFYNIGAWARPSYYLLNPLFLLSAKKKRDQAKLLQARFFELMNIVNANQLIQQELAGASIHNVVMRYWLNPIIFFSKTGLDFEVEMKNIKKAQYHKPNLAKLQIEDALKFIRVIAQAGKPGAIKRSVGTQTTTSVETST